ncbi:MULTISPECIES: squalene/phytoene synthase family protein [Streptomyces]|uniref:Phytoene synthase n=2 Tax=Streptomyces TaxID=1883 RepID=A0ABT9LHL8_STRGD|nr:MULTISPECIES: squalene/phytoene synthase family protein [Streptomyces]MDP9683198.1 phytoene synthase [Streptomyces griseoviridis]GGT26785.1 phytoene synthase [Streptomyces griseoviridis]GGU28065.1 phytoene synthase [Streptomyces daghestanicus]GHI31890.1 phytoene synthase [Streptomyces daghestanicus]
MTAAIDQTGLRADFAACTAFMRRRGAVVYAMPRMLLPPDRRPYCDAVQAFTIYADKLIDDPRVPVADRRRRYQDYSRAVLALLETGDPDRWDGPRSPEDTVGRHLARAFAHFTRVWDVPPESVRRLLDTMAGDAEATEYPTFADLDQYIRGTGVPYIHWINALLGRRAHTSEVAREKAAAAIFGLALTDNLQDLAEDLTAGRLCLPVEDLRAFGLDRDDLARAVREWRMPGPVRDLVRFEADRAYRYLEQADGWWRTADPVARELPRQYVRLTLHTLRRTVGAEYDLFAPRRRARLTWGARACAGFALGYGRARVRWSARLPDRRPRPASN